MLSIKSIVNIIGIKRRTVSVNDKTSIQISPETRDRLYKLKFRRTYDQFLSELCDLYEKEHEDES